MRNIFRYGLVGPLFVLLVVTGFAGKANAQLKEIVSAMDTNNRLLASLQADISMSKWDAGLRASDGPVRQGTTVYLPRTAKQEMRARIDWKNPVVESLAIQGDQYKLYQPRLKQMIEGTVQKGKGNAGNALSFMNMKREQLRADYDTVYVDEERLADSTPTWHIQLTPKKVVSYKLVDLWVDREGMPRQVRITEQNNDWTKILLTNVHKNDTIKGSAFSIDLEKGTVIKKP
jgi:outer membrane lipoprotein-sorting protein